MSALEDALELIRDPSRWCRDAYARDADGERRGPNEKDAVRWCAEGALLHVTDVPTFELLRELDHVAFGLYGIGVSRVNDDLGHEAVIRCYEGAIARDR